MELILQPRHWETFLSRSGYTLDISTGSNLHTGSMPHTGGVTQNGSMPHTGITEANGNTITGNTDANGNSRTEREQTIGNGPIGCGVVGEGGKLGTGSFGDVFAVVKVDTGQTWAVKRLVCRGEVCRDKYIMAEIDALTQLEVSINQM